MKLGACLAGLMVVCSTAAAVAAPPGTTEVPRGIDELRAKISEIDGFLSSYGYLPGQGVGFVLLVNSTRSLRAVLAIRHLLVEYLLQHETVPPPPRAEVPEAELARWAGTYHPAAPRHQLLAFLERLAPGVELYVERGRLFARPRTSRPTGSSASGYGATRSPRGCR